MRGCHRLHSSLFFLALTLLLVDKSTYGAEFPRAVDPKPFVSEFTKQSLRCVSPTKICRWLGASRPNIQEVRRIRSGIAQSVPLIQFYARHLSRRDLPLYYALIPYIESRNNPAALSEKGALGVWQIMPETAKDLGLLIGSVDMRKNVIWSTSLVMALLEDLHLRYNGNVIWVLAAYNWGPSRVDRLIASRTTDVNSLPLETSQYIQRFFSTWIAIKQKGVRDVLEALPNLDYLDVKPPSFSASVYRHDSYLLGLLNVARRPRDPWLVPSRNFYLYYRGTYLTAQ